MSESILAPLLVILVYRIVALLTGAFIIYLGYKLFSLGVFEKAGELKAAWGERNLHLKQASPGTFLLLFGTIILITMLIQTASLETRIDETFDDQFRALSPKSDPATAPGDSARVGLQQATIFRLDWLGGETGAVPLSIALRRVLSDYAVCLSNYVPGVTDEVLSTCQEKLGGMLKSPVSEVDLDQIEELEMKCYGAEDASACEELLRWKNRLLN